MAIVAIDDTDPKGAIVIGLYRELQAREAEGAYYGTVTAEVELQGSRVVYDDLSRRRKRKWLAKSGKP